MTTPEQPRSGVEQQQKAPAEAAVPLFAEELDRTRKIIGPEQPPLPPEPTEKDLDDAERALTGDNAFDTFSEQFRSNEIRYRRGELQRLAELSDPKKAAGVDREELVTVNQAVTYHEYFPQVAREVMDVMSRYEVLRSTIKDVPLEIAQGEQQARLYFQALNEALRERVAFANVLLVEGKLERGAGDAASLRRLAESYRASKDLSPASIRALQGSTAEKWRRGNDLNQRIIEVLAGAAPIAGVPKDFLPQYLYTQLLRYRYEQMLEVEKRSAKDPTQEVAKKRFAILAEANEKARKGEGKPLSADEAKEYEELRERMKGQKTFMESLGVRRHEMTKELVGLTDRMGNYQMRMLALTDIQHQFGDRFSFEGVHPPKKDTTPPSIAGAMAEHMEQRREFHAERLQDFFHSVEGDVLAVGAAEITEDEWNKNGREAMRKFSNAMAKLYTFWIPKTFGLRDKMRQSLAGPLNEAMGWPPGKEKWEELTEEEKNNVREKAKSVLDAIRSFDRSKMQTVAEDVEVINTMRPASDYAGQEVRQPLPVERITLANREAKIGEYGGATVHLMLLRQMQEDWGTTEPPAGFMGQYATFLESVNKTVDVHVQVGEALFQARRAWEGMMREYLWAAIVAFGLAAVAAVLGRRVIWAMMRTGGRLVWQGGKLTLRASSSLVRTTGEQLSGLARKVGPAEASETVAAEQALAKAPGAARFAVAKYLGPAAAVLTAWELQDALRLANSLHALPDMQAVDAAFEVIKGHPKLTSLRGKLKDLERRRQLIAMRDVAGNLLRRLEESSQDYQPQRARELLTKGRDIVQLAAAQDTDLERRFPIADYIHRSDRDPAGVVRVDYDHLPEAMRRGEEYVQQKELYEGMRRFGRKQPLLPPASAETDFSVLERRYLDFLQDIVAYFQKKERVTHPADGSLLSPEEYRAMFRPDGSAR